MAHDIHAHRILILDFGSQYTQLIARRVREIGVYCELHPFDMDDAAIREFAPKGIILAGGPESVHEAGSPRAPQAVFDLSVMAKVGYRLSKHCEFGLSYQYGCFNTLKHFNNGPANGRRGHLSDLMLSVYVPFVLK